MKTQSLSKLIVSAALIVTGFSASSQEADEKDIKKIQVSFVYPLGSNGQNSGQV